MAKHILWLDNESQLKLDEPVMKLFVILYEYMKEIRNYILRWKGQVISTHPCNKCS